MSDKRHIRRITIQQVAREAGTSPSTVSRVLNRSAPVREELRDAVLQAVATLGYRPNLLARSLKIKATHCLGLVINDILNPFYSAVARGVEDCASPKGYAIMLCNTNEDPRRELEMLYMLRDKAVDGIILTPTGQNLAAVEELLTDGIAVIQIDRRLPELRASAVVVDNAGGAYQAARHLLSHGHRRIALVTYNFERMTLAEREHGFRQAMAEAALPVDDRDICRVSFYLEDLREQLSLLLAAPNPPTALLAANNRIAIGVLGVVKELCLRIPDDIAIVVFDDLELFELCSPGITAVAQPAYTMGQKATELLMSQLASDGPIHTQTVVFHPELIVRQSSGPHKEE